MPRPIRIGRIAGIPVDVHPSWFVAFVLLTATLALVVLPQSTPGASLVLRLVLASVTTVLVYASLLAHEMSHSLVARRFGIPVDRVTLFVFGGVSQLLDEPRTAAHEVLLAIAGPLVSIVLGVAWLLLYLTAAGAASSEWLLSSISYLAGVNFVIAAFNLLPGYPMDGGRVLHAYLWWATGDRLAATRAASWIGRALGGAVAALGLWVVIAGGIEGVWLIVVGLFIVSLARASYRRQLDRLRGARVAVGRMAMRPAPAVDEGADAAASSIEALRRGLAALAVVSGDRLVGILPAERAYDAGVGTTAGELAVRDRAWLIDAGESLGSAIRRIELGAPALGVVEAGRLIGLLTPAMLARSRP